MATNATTENNSITDIFTQGLSNLIQGATAKLTGDKTSAPGTVQQSTANGATLFNSPAVVVALVGFLVVGAVVVLAKSTK